MSRSWLTASSSGRVSQARMRGTKERGLNQQVQLGDHVSQALGLALAKGAHLVLWRIKDWHPDMGSD
jgi:hypothetical protein